MAPKAFTMKSKLHNALKTRKITKFYADSLEYINFARS